MTKGKIYKLKKEFRENYEKKFYKHPFIFFECEKDYNYRGIMLTTSNLGCFGNIKLEENHFKDLEGYIKYGKSKEFPHSYIAPLYLLKEAKMEHLEIIGEMSAEGIEFILDCIAKNKLEYTDWKNHVKKSTK